MPRGAKVLQGIRKRRGRIREARRGFEASPEALVRDTRP